ncbi:MAG: type II toxin-antitoxin system VapC family toxin [archaeon]|nr:type II toxin-antitoxin system VapC family toxin [archaeon]MCP8315090.1 type II toxin-antitoxin system VapC family toxin [archaeon]MCP8317851.1 type II toxin-antitoxin system VapC family toxin [archaeon]MCP8319399.1 type II toxin-antitoxin system VapC family toxin [archaeon]
MKYVDVNVFVYWLGDDPIYGEMSKYNLDLEDAIHLSVALRVNAKEIYSKDADFDRTPLKRIWFEEK